MSWCNFRPIGELVSPIKSWTPTSSDDADSFTYIDLSAVDQEAKILNGARKIACSEAPSRARQLVQSGDILVSTVRPNLNGVAQVPVELGGATASTGFCVLRPRANELDGRYLFQWVKSPTFIQEMVRRATGASYPAVSDRIVQASEIPLPSIEEQRRIAAILDKAEKLCEKRKEMLKLLDSSAQSVFVDMFGDPVQNPKNWPRVRFGELLDRIESGWSPVCLDRPAQGDEWAVLKLGAVTSCEYDSNENKALPMGLAPDPRLEVKPGDLLFSRKNTYELVAACALVFETRPRLMMPDLIFRFRINPGVDLDVNYLHQLLVNTSKRGELRKLASGSAGSMPNISKAKLLDVQIEVPPESLQLQFARRVTKLREQVQLQRRALIKNNALFRALQYKAFLGEL